MRRSEHCSKFCNQLEILLTVALIRETMNADRAFNQVFANMSILHLQSWWQKNLKISNEQLIACAEICTRDLQGATFCGLRSLKFLSPARTVQQSSQRTLCIDAGTMFI